MVQKSISIGKKRGMQRLASSRGTLTCLALDHRQNLRRSLNPANPEAVSNQALTDFKLEVAAALAEEATAVLLDPEYSAAQAIARGILPGQTGLVIALEATGYTGDPTARTSRILPGWSVEKAKRMGADAVKLLVYYHPESDTAAEIEAFVVRVAEECQNFDLALMLEPLSYSLDPHQKLSSSEKRVVVVETARRLTPLGIELLKAEFPLNPLADPDEQSWEAACEEITQASTAPWILLSAAVDYETYLKQVTIACEVGASGVAVGRAVWKEAVDMPPSAREKFLVSTARPRLARLNSLCNALAHPWNLAQSAIEVPPDWYSQDEAT